MAAPWRLANEAYGLLCGATDEDDLGDASGHPAVVMAAAHPPPGWQRYNPQKVVLHQAGTSLTALIKMRAAPVLRNTAPYLICVNFFGKFIYSFALFYAITGLRECVSVDNGSFGLGGGVDLGPSLVFFRPGCS